MADKKNIHDVVRIMANETNRPASELERFLNTAHSIIIDNLKKEEPTEIQNLGSFRTVEMGERESVSVSTGKRVVIPSYKKVAFSSAQLDIQPATPMEEPTPSDILDDEVMETPGTNDERISVEEPSDMEETTQLFPSDEETVVVTEKPLDEFSGIDVLIATPESIQELHELKSKNEKEMRKLISDIESKRAEFDRLTDEIERIRKELEQKDERENELQTRIANVESNAKTLIDRSEIAAAGLESVAPQSSAAAQKKVEEKTVEKVSSDAASKDKGKKKLIYAISAIVLLAILALGSYFTFNNSSQQQRDAQLSTEKRLADKARRDSIRAAKAKADSIAVADSLKAAKAKKNEIHKVVFDGTIPLEILVTRHYGEHDIVYKVIKYNREHGVFDDWKNIPRGTELLFPNFDE